LMKIVALFVITTFFSLLIKILYERKKKKFLNLKLNYKKKKKRKEKKN